MDEDTDNEQGALIDSPLLGETRDATPKQREEIRRLVEATPLLVYQELNKAFNKRGLCLAIDSIHPH